jgi:hypothetical protein
MQKYGLLHTAKEGAIKAQELGRRFKKAVSSNTCGTSIQGASKAAGLSVVCMKLSAAVMFHLWTA